MEEIRILLYHSVGKVDPQDDLGIRVDKDEFRRQMEFLKKDNYNVWLLKDAVDCIKKKKPIPQKTTVITFDDGYRDNIQNAVPIMEEFGFRATFFVTVKCIGGIKTSPHRSWQHWEYMNRNELKDLINRGHGIGSHSYHHVDLLKIDKEVKHEELKLSKEGLSSLLNKEIDLLSYPYGCFDDELAKIAEDGGYKAACTITAGTNGYSTDLFKLKRIEIVNKDTLDDFKHKLETSYE